MTASDNPPSPRTPQETSYTYLALGDSYTIGESVAVADRWSVQLAALLTKRGKNILTPDIIAKTGWTTAELIKGIEDAGLSGTYSIVSLLIGVNNQYRGQAVETYRHEFKTLLETALAYAGGNRAHVFVVSIPDWGVTPFAAGRDTKKIAQEIDAFNTVAAAVCRQEGISFVDITPVSRARGAEAAMLASDGLHYSGAMYAVWAEQALPVAVKMLP